MHSIHTKNRTTSSFDSQTIQSIDHADTFGTLNSNIIVDSDFDSENQDEFEKKMAKMEENTKDEHLQYFIKLLQLVKGNDLKGALTLYEEMRKEYIRPRVYTLTLLIGACGRAGYTKMALKLFNQLRSYDYTPYPTTLTGLFNSFAEGPYPTKGLEEANKLREKIYLNGWDTNQIVYNTMIKAFGKCGDLKTAFELVDEMHTKKMSLLPDTYNHILMACISDKEAGFSHGIQVFRLMRQFESKPDRYSYYHLLRIIKECGAGPPEVKSQLLLKWPKSNLNYSLPPLLSSGVSEKHGFLEKADISEENSVIVLNNELSPKEHVVSGIRDLSTSQNRFALIGGVSNLMKQMKADNVKPDAKMMSYVIDCLPNTLESEENILNLIDKLRLAPDVAFFNQIIKKRCFGKQQYEAKQVLDHLYKYNLKPDIITYGALALSCHTPEECIQFLNDMKVAGIPPNIQIIGALMGTALFRNNYYLVLYLMRYMQYNRIAPDTKILDKIEKARQDLSFKLNQHKKKKITIDNPYLTSRAFEKHFTRFNAEYPEWCKKVSVETPAHPWAQYKPDKLTKES